MLPEKGRFRAIIFDLDGTLYHMKWYMRPLLFVNLFPRPFRLPRYQKIRKNYSGKDLGDYRNLITCICKDLVLLENCSEEDAKKWIEQSFYKAFIKTLGLMRNSRPGLNEAIAYLKEKEYKIAVLSDYDKINERLDVLNIDKNKFDVIMSSEYCGALKPSPRPFIEISEKLSIPKSEILVIGDRDDTDGAAARSSGMSFLQITDKTEHGGECLGWIELREYLLSL